MFAAPRRKGLNPIPRQGENRILMLKSFQILPRAPCRFVFSITPHDSARQRERPHVKDQWNGLYPSLPLSPPSFHSVGEREREHFPDISI